MYIYIDFSPGYLSVIPFLFQDFGSFSLSIFGIFSQVDSLSLPLLLFLYLLSIPLSLHLGYIAAFGVAFLYSGNLWSSPYYVASSLWVGLYQWLVKVSWLGRLVLEFWWVELDFFSLECNGVTSNGL